MKLTAEMIASSMQKHLIHAEIINESDIGYDSIRVLLPDQLHLEAGCVYVAERNQLCKMANIDSSCLIISTQGKAIGLPCSYLLCRGSLNEIYAAALDAVRAYSKLEDDLNDGLLKEKGIEYFLEVCSGFFGNTVQIIDPALNVVAGITPVYEDGRDKPSAFEKRNTGFSAELVSEMIKNDLLRQTFEFKTAQYFKTSLFANGAIHLSLFDEDKYLGKLLIIDDHRLSTQGDLDIVNNIGKYFKQLMIKRRAVVNANLFTAEYFASEILSGRITDATFVSAQLSSIGWDIHDPYNILYIPVSSQDILNYYAQSLSGILSNALVFPLEEGLVAVNNLKTVSLENEEKKVSRFLRETGLSCGQSEVFNDFLSADSFYIQSKSAVQMGMKANMGQKLFHYHNFAIDHFISAAVSMQYERVFVHPAFQTIKNYDKENGTDYLHTLKVYLDSGMNQVLSAKMLHVHRNSLKYRLARLIEITGVNLDDTNERLRLILSFRLNEF